MKKILFAVITTISLTTTASAGCYGAGGYVSCSDGNTYNTIGNTTFGYNYRTGSSWTQSTIGGYTFGTDASGNSWSNW